MLSARLISLRKTKKRTQQEIADYIGITRPAYTAYERGTRNPDYEILQKLANYYDVTTDYLLGHSDNPEKTSDEEFESFANDPELKRWYRELPESDEEDLQKLRQMWEIIKSDKRKK
ncbi:HTH-type transcriptional regulator immR [Lysinibacillus sphaericus]|nr:HTH-type transcriptional regulator immR [Lysinibacillus sphaericus]